MYSEVPMDAKSKTIINKLIEKFQAKLSLSPPPTHTHKKKHTHTKNTHTHKKENK